MEFPPLSTETAEPTEERFTYNDTSETVKHTDERRTDNENDDMTFVSPQDTTWGQFTINSRRQEGKHALSG